MTESTGDEVLIPRSALRSLLTLAFGQVPLVVRDGALVFYPTVRSMRLPLTELTGVGLVLTWNSGTNRRISFGWYLTLWDRDQKPYQIEESFLPAKFPSQSGDGPLNETADQIATSSAASVAKKVYDLAYAVQGSTGPLATLQAQRFTKQSVWKRDPNYLAYWSPDNGEIGRKPVPTALTDPD